MEKYRVTLSIERRIIFDSDFQVEDVMELEEPLRKAVEVAVFPRLRRMLRELRKREEGIYDEYTIGINMLKLKK